MAARRFRLRLEPYNPDARDADGDGIVQENTAWERPAGTRILNELGEEIKRGLFSPKRNEKFSVIDKDGKKVDYIPSYAKQAKIPTERPKASLEKRGFQTISSRGIRSLDEIVTEAIVLSRVADAVFEPTRLDSASPAPPVEVLSQQRDAQRILDRNAEIADRIAELGGSITNDIDDAFIEKNGSFSLGRSALETKSQAFDRRRQRMAADFEAVRTAIRNGGIVEEGPPTITALEDRLRHGKTAPKINQILFDGISPEVKDLIATKTDQELFEIMERRALEFQQGLDRRVRVRASQSTLLRIAEDGRYKTTHEARSFHSGADVRSRYEVHLGIPYEAEAELRPASGYVVHPDWERTQIDHLRPYLGDMSDEDISKRLFRDVTNNPAGHVTIYGETEIVLKPEVSGRTQYGRGDSLTSVLRPTSMDSDNPEEIMQALNWSGGQVDGESIKYATNLLQTEVDGHFGNLNLYHPKHDPDGTRNTENLQRGYFEALIGGSFSVDDIEVVRLSVQDLDLFTKNDDDLSDQGFVDAIANTDRLRSLGFSDEEIAYIMANKDVWNFSSWFKDYRDFKRRERAKQIVEGFGFPVEYVQDLPGGRDPFELGSYRGSEGYTSIEDLLIARSRENVRNDIERARQRAERQALIDSGLLIEDEEESVA